MKPQTIGLLGCAANSLVLFFNHGFTTSSDLAKYDPEFFGWSSQMLILIWGGCYLAAGLDNASRGRRGGWIWGMFAIEKVVYVAR
jgi:hypothetical protein